MAFVSDLVKTTIWVSVCPTGTLPKRRLDSEHVNCCAVADTTRRGSNVNVTNTMMMMIEKIWVEKSLGARLGESHAVRLNFAESV